MKKTLIFLAITGLFFASCKKDDAVTETDFNTQEYLKSTESSKIADEVTSIIIEDYEEDAASRSSEATVPYLPACVTRTISSSGQTHSVELDFGTTGCTMPNGNVITGVLLYTYVGDLSANAKTITYSFSNFTFNSKQVTGTDTIDHLRDNGNGNPQSTIHVNLTITWPDGTVGDRTGTLVREWVTGHNTLLDWTDDVFHVTGNWSTQFDNGNIYTATITTTLVRELNCIHFVSGIIDFNYAGLEFTGDYGNGSCDNDAVITLSNGVQYNINL